jgi:hypothetical protein
VFVQLEHALKTYAFGTPGQITDDTQFCLQLTQNTVFEAQVNTLHVFPPQFAENDCPVARDDINGLITLWSSQIKVAFSFTAAP